jgi:hypothetical protein
VQSKGSEDRSAPCSCVKDAFAALPPGLRPRPKKQHSLRQVTCPECGLDYWTNRSVNLCIKCEGKGTATTTNENIDEEEK